MQQCCCCTTAVVHSVVWGCYHSCWCCKGTGAAQNTLQGRPQRPDVAGEHPSIAVTVRSRVSRPQHGMINALGGDSRAWQGAHRLQLRVYEGDAWC